MTNAQFRDHLAVRSVTPQAARAHRLLTARADKGISTLEATMAYGMPRFAARVHELRAAGISIGTHRKVDEKGQPYARYVLEA